MVSSTMLLPTPGLRNFDEQAPPGNTNKHAVLVVLSFRFKRLQLFLCQGIV